MNSAKDIYAKLNIKAGARHTSLTESEGEFLHTLVKRLRPKKTLELGFAFGVSTVFIMLATGKTHYAIDPWHDSLIYGGAGIKNIVKFKLKPRLKLIKDFSQLALPRLLDKKLSFDFVFVDGSHLFDDQFVDFYYLDKLLETGGHVVLHDATSSPTLTLLSWIKTNKKNYSRIKSKQDNFAVLLKKSDDTRKWHHFEKFAVEVGAPVSPFL